MTSPGDDWRPMPTSAEAAAHASLSGGDCWGRWMLLSDDYGFVTLRIVSIAATYDDTTKAVGIEVLDGHDAREPKRSDLVRPVSAIGEAMPWPLPLPGGSVDLDAVLGRLRDAIAAALGVSAPHATLDEVIEDARARMAQSPSAEEALRIRLACARARASVVPLATDLVRELWPWPTEPTREVGP